VHSLAMWLIFERLLPRLVIGTLYVIPIAFVESIVLIVVFFRLERWLLHKTEIRGQSPNSSRR